MTPDDVRHGTYAGANAHYKTGNELCDPCREARRTYGRRTAKNRRRGWRGIVPPDQARTHVHALRAAGMSYDTIADLAGLSRSTVHRIAGLDSNRGAIKARSAALVLAVTPAITDQAFVPLYMVRRRLQALQALGWSLTEIGNRCGWNSRNLLALVRDNTWRPRETVSAATFNKIDATYRELCMSLPPHNRSTSGVRNRAQRNGWLPPLAYDNIDDPDEQPRKGSGRAGKHEVDAAVVSRVMAGDKLPMTRAERVAVVTQMSAAGWSQGRIEQHTGITRVDRLIQREAS